MHNQKHQQPHDIIPSTYAIKRQCKLFYWYHEWIEHGNNGQVTTSNFTSNYIINLLQVTIKFYNLI